MPQEGPRALPAPALGIATRASHRRARPMVDPTVARHPAVPSPGGGHREHRARASRGHAHRPRWRNWQTRRTQTPLAARSSGFKSRPRHHGWRRLGCLRWAVCFGDRRVELAQALVTGDDLDDTRDRRRRPAPAGTDRALSGSVRCTRERPPPTLAAPVHPRPDHPGRSAAPWRPAPVRPTRAERAPPGDEPEPVRRGGRNVRPDPGVLSEVTRSANGVRSAAPVAHRR